MDDFFRKISPNTKVLDLSGLGLKHLPCILRFKKLEELRIENNQLTYLPPFPSTLKRIYCSNNKLKKLPPLPIDLEVLECSDNPQLSTIPLYKGSLLVNLENTAIDLRKFVGLNPVLYKIL